MHTTKCNGQQNAISCPSLEAILQLPRVSLSPQHLPHGILDAGYRERRLVRGHFARHVEARLDQDAMPRRFPRRHVLVGAPDVRRRVVADHVDRRQRRHGDARVLLGGQAGAAVAKDLLAVRKGGLRRLAEHGGLEGGAAVGGGVPDGAEGVGEGALAELGGRGGVGPGEVAVGEVEGGLAVLLVAAVGEVGAAVEGGDGAEDAVFGEGEVEGELDVETPVAGVLPEEDGGDLGHDGEFAALLLREVLGQRSEA